MKFVIKTFGCQMNVHDSEHIAGMLEAAGHHPTDRIDRADIVVFNTCCVREHADKRLYGSVASLKSLKAARPELMIAVGGCLAQRERQKLQEKLPHIDVVFGTHNRDNLINLIEQARSTRAHVCQIWEEPLPAKTDLPAHRESTIKAWVPITTGCNNFCSYCVVPYVRGKEISRRMEDIITEVKTLASDGVREVTLLGQNVNSYGQDLYGKPAFAELLKQLSTINRILRIRFTTSHPKDFKDELIEQISHSQKICRHIHLPLQAGSSRVLQAMNRGYSKEEYLTLAEKIRKRLPGVSLTTDIMVGFPGETEDDFEDTLDVVAKVRFDQAFTFIYSPREGTPAAKLLDQIPYETKLDRFKRLVEMQNRITLEENQKRIDHELEVLVEGYSKKGNLLTGRTDTNKVVNFQADPSLINQLVMVRIVEAHTWYLQGVLSDQSPITS